jgi:hypothetical protein
VLRAFCAAGASGLRGTLVLAALLVAGPAWAAVAGGPALPAGRVQLLPVVHLFAVPLEPVAQPPLGGGATALDLAYSNMFQVERADGGRTRFDADLELLTLTPRLTWRPLDRLDLGAALPVHVVGGGFLDRPIQDFHDLTESPNGGRELYPNDRMASRMVVDGRLVYQGESGYGVGDLALTQSLRLAGGNGRPFAVALRTGVELPTGDAERGLGSGEVDLGAALAVTLATAGGARLHAQALASLPGDLAGASRVSTHAAYGFGVAAEGPLLPDRLVALAHLDFRTPFASHTELQVLDDPLVSGGFGLGVRLGAYWLTLGVTEDLRTATAPDITILIRVSPRL